MRRRRGQGGERLARRAGFADAGASAPDGAGIDLDDLQIGAALVVAGDDPVAPEFVTFDQLQAAAAEREGFHVRGAS